MQIKYITPTMSKYHKYQRWSSTITNAKGWQRTYYAAPYKDYSKKEFRVFFARNKRMRILCMPYNNCIGAIYICQSYDCLSYKYNKVYWKILEYKLEKIIIVSNDISILKFYIISKL